MKSFLTNGVECMRACPRTVTRLYQLDGGGERGESRGGTDARRITKEEQKGKVRLRKKETPLVKGKSSKTELSKLPSLIKAEAAVFTTD